MSDKQNMTLNRLPAPTWNRLNMNLAQLSMEKPIRGCDIKVLGDLRSVTQSDKVLSGEPWEEIETAMGADFGSFLDETPITLLESAQNVTADKAIVVNCEYGQGVCAGNRLFLNAAKGSVLSVVAVLSGEAADTAALQVKIHAEENARVLFSMVQMLGEDARVLTDIGGSCEKNASIEIVKLELGGGEQYAGVGVDLKGDRSAFKVQTGYHVRGNQRLDMNYLVRHHGKRTVSEMSASGILEEDSFKIFRGTIDFPKGCAGAVGNEKEDVLLLGDRQVNQTIPLILCSEEDVEGNHGATIGRLSEQTLFYLGTRGISKQAAEGIIAKARLDAVCAQVPDSTVQERISGFLCHINKE